MSTNLFRHSPRLVELVLGATLACASLATGCKPKTDPPVAPPPPPVTVTTDTVTAVDAPRILRLTGTLRGQRETDLAANVAGRVTSMNLERGQRIAKGDLIAVVDVSAAALALAEARVAVATSQTQQSINQVDCERYEKLKASGAVTDLEYDQVTAKCKTAPLNLEAAQARQSIAAKNVGDGRIRAPYAGIVTDRFIEVGEYVQPSTRVIALAQVGDLRLEFSLPEQNYPEIFACLAMVVGKPSTSASRPTATSSSPARWRTSRAPCVRRATCSSKRASRTPTLVCCPACSRTWSSRSATTRCRPCRSRRCSTRTAS